MLNRLACGSRAARGKVAQLHSQPTRSSARRLHKVTALGAQQRWNPHSMLPLVNIAAAGLLSLLFLLDLLPRSRRRSGPHTPKHVCQRGRETPTSPVDGLTARKRCYGLVVMVRSVRQRRSFWHNRQLLKGGLPGVAGREAGTILDLGAKEPGCELSRRVHRRMAGPASFRYSELDTEGE